MNRKWIGKIISMLLFISMLSIYLPAEADAVTCEHEYAHWTFEPTCTEEGYTYHQCNLCGDTYSDAFVPAKGHTPNIPEPTETEYQRCTECLAVIDYLSITGNAGQGVTFLLDRNGVMTFSGTGDIELVTHAYLDNMRVTEIVINEGIRFIRDDALPAFPNLISVSFPETLRVIGKSAFDGCTKLASVEFPNSLERIGSFAFQNCLSLTDLSFPERTWIECYAFADCTGLNKLVLPINGRTDQCAFARCTELTDVELHGISSGPVFEDCTGLKNVVIGSDVPSMEGNVFAGCTALTTIHIPGNVKTMSYTFQGCTSLKNVTMDYGVERIGDKAFSDCEAMESIVIPASVTEIGDSVFWISKIASKLTSICFGGNAPVFASNALHGLGHSTICYYPAGNSTWNSDTMKHHGSTTVRWQSYVHAHNYVTAVTEPGCTTPGYTTYTCLCGDGYQEAIPAHGHSWDGDICAVCGTAIETKAPMYRLYNPYTLEHLLTMDAAERDMLVNAGWTLDGIAFRSPGEGQPVYRLYNPFDDWHTYTMSQDEIDTLLPLGWKIDGIVCRSASSENGKIIYRLFNPYEQKNYHLLTSSEEERTLLESAGWIVDGGAWYCLAE